VGELLRKKIDELLTSATLTLQEREVIKLRYGLTDGYAFTEEEVAEIFKVSREQARQIEAAALRKLQQPRRSPPEE
jgi:RNA polymerase primary sigma factor